MKTLLFLFAFYSSYSYAIFIHSGSPLGGTGINMARTTQTLNQVDKSSDGKLTRDQSIEKELDPPPGESYNDEKHREYVRQRKLMQSKNRP
jgi:hypothetical protein